MLWKANRFELSPRSYHLYHVTRALILTSRSVRGQALPHFRRQFRHIIVPDAFWLCDLPKRLCSADDALRPLPLLSAVRRSVHTLWFDYRGSAELRLPVDWSEFVALRKLVWVGRRSFRPIGRFGYNNALPDDLRRQLFDSDVTMAQELTFRTIPPKLVAHLQDLAWIRIQIVVLSDPVKLAATENYTNEAAVPENFTWAVC